MTKGSQTGTISKWLRAPALAAIFTLCGILAAAAVEVEEQFTRQLPLTAEGTLVLSNQNGSITVQTWDNLKVVLDCRKVVTADREDEAREWMEKVRITITQDSPERIEVNTERPDNGGWGMLSFLFGERPDSRVDYRIRVPRQARLRVSSVNGSLEIVEPAGMVHSDTVNGSIRVQKADCPVQAETVNGQVELDFVPLLRHGAVQWLARLSSINGSVTIQLPAGPSVDVQASTLNGSILGDFQLPVNRDFVGASASASIGGGGPDVVMETLNGTIRILENQ